MSDQGEMRATEKMQSIFSVAPTDLGISPLTALYKLVTSRLKVMPFIYLVPVCVLTAIFAYLIFGHALVRLTTLLQYGF